MDLKQHQSNAELYGERHFYNFLRNNNIVNYNYYSNSPKILTLKIILKIFDIAINFNKILNFQKY